jgi:hypothetical protein
MPVRRMRKGEREHKRVTVVTKTSTHEARPKIGRFLVDISAGEKGRGPRLDDAEPKDTGLYERRVIDIALGMHFRSKQS